MDRAIVHPNHHASGAEIAGNWPPAWFAYVGASKVGPNADILVATVLLDYEGD